MPIQARTRYGDADQPVSGVRRITNTAANRAIRQIVIRMPKAPGPLLDMRGWCSRIAKASMGLAAIAV